MPLLDQEPSDGNVERDGLTMTDKAEEVERQRIARK